jgi:hypothetical protein
VWQPCGVAADTDTRVLAEDKAKVEAEYAYDDAYLK